MKANDLIIRSLVEWLSELKDCLKGGYQWLITSASLSEPLVGRDSQT